MQDTTRSGVWIQLLISVDKPGLINFAVWG
jgi:hypothetical protein